MLSHYGFNDHNMKNFNGLDISPSISWQDYGFLYKLTNEEKKEYLFYVATERDSKGIITDYNWAYFSLADWIELTNESWFDVNRVSDYTGQTPKEFIENFPLSFYDAIQYHGINNIGAFKAITR